MSKTQTPQFEPGMVAVLHRTDSAWRGMVANTRGSRPSIVNTSEFPADRTGRIDAWLDEYKVGQVMCVLPAATVITRNCALPDASPEQLEQALALQAEAHLLGMAPPHRLGMAVLPNSNGETSRAGIILAWPEAAEFEAPPTSRQVRYVPDVAAMAALLNGSRPTEPLIWLDRTDGSVALALTHTGGAVFRGTREDAESPDQWQRSVGRVVAETGLSVGHTGAFIDNLARGAQQMASSLRSNQSALFLPREIIASANQRVQGASGDVGWWSRFGIPLGAVLARSGPLASLTQFLDAPPLEAPSRIKSFVSSLSQPRTAFRLAVACVLLLAFGPLLVHAARWGLLRLRFGNLDSQVAAVGEFKQKARMYEAMVAQNTWPMTKLLADIASNTPEGIDLEQIRIEHGSEFNVQGTSHASSGKSPTEVVAQMSDDLNKSGIFKDIVYDWGGGTSMGVFKFNMSGKLSNPYRQKEYDVDHDFKIWTLQARQGGEPKPAGNVAPKNGTKPEPTATAPDNTAMAKGGSENGPSTLSSPRVSIQGAEPSNPDDEPEAGGERSDRGAKSSSEHPMGSETGEIGSGDGGALPAHMIIPDPLTQDQVDKMELADAKAQLTVVSTARKNPSLTIEQKARLKAEFDMLLKRINKLNPPKS